MINEYTVLNNDERRYFGLDPILPDWVRAEIKPGFAVYFDGNTIRKTLSFHTLSGEGYENYLEYIECDNEIETRDRQFVLPRTARGKEKKLNFTSVNAMKPTGCFFRVTLARPGVTSTLWTGNSRNALSLPITFRKNIDTLEHFREWLADYIATCPPDYFEKVERMKNTLHRTVKYFNGDIFRFELDRAYYAFGLIMGQLRKLEKEGLLPEEHVLRSTMGVPLLVRLYLLKTRDKNLSVEAIAAHPLGKTFLMMDDSILWGAYDIVGSKTLTAQDIDFPIQAGDSLSSKPHTRFCWGLGMILRKDTRDLPEEIRNNRLMRHAVHFGVNRTDFERAMDAGETKAGPDELEQIAFQYFNLSPEMSFDEFNRQNGGMTRKEYAEYANKSGRRVS